MNTILAQPPSHQDARRRACGFSLIELMIVVAIVAVLAAIAYPSYQEQIRKARRTDAKTALLDLAARQERFYSVQNTYASKPSSLGYTVAGDAFPMDVNASSSASFYELTLTVVAPTAGTPASFIATAKRLTGPQSSDRCGDFVVNQLGVQSLANASTGVAATDCW